MNINNNYPESFYTENGNIRANIFGKPLKIDTSSSDEIYLAYCYVKDNLEPNGSWLIEKIVIDGDIIERYFANGNWEDRLTLIYIGE